MSHANALLTPRGRLLLAQVVVDQGERFRRAVERFQVSTTTAARWAGRYRQLGGHNRDAAAKVRSVRPLAHNRGSLARRVPEARPSTDHRSRLARLALSGDHAAALVALRIIDQRIRLLGLADMGRGAPPGPVSIVVGPQVGT